jgi:hypothetical protein
VALGRSTSPTSTKASSSTTWRCGPGLTVCSVLSPPPHLLEHCALALQVKGLEAGDTVHMGAWLVQTFPTQHRVPSLGFLLYHRTKLVTPLLRGPAGCRRMQRCVDVALYFWLPQPLPEEYRRLPPAELAALRQRGVRA